MNKLRIGFVGVSVRSYFAEEWNQIGQAPSGLEQLAEELDFELVAVS